MCASFTVLTTASLAATKLSPSYQQALEKYENGDYANALVQAKMAALGGDAKAMTMVGYILVNGLAGQIDKDEAVKWYLDAAKLGQTDAMMALSELALAGVGGLNSSDAVKWLKKAANNGNTDAMRALADIYRLGKGVAPNPAEAQNWLERAGNFGDVNAIRKQADRLLDSDPKKALALYEQAARQGDAKSAYIAGIMYVENLDIRPNSAKSAKYLRQAANAGIAAAQADYGLIVYQGNGVERDIKAAAKWFEKSAKAGDPEGQFLYAFTLAKGEGLKQDFEQAYYWLLVAEKNLRQNGNQDYDRTQMELKKRLEENVSEEILARARKRFENH